MKLTEKSSFTIMKLHRWWNIKWYWHQILQLKIIEKWFSAPGHTLTSALRSERILTTHLLTAIWKVKLMTPRSFSNASSQRLRRAWQATGDGRKVWEDVRNNKGNMSWVKGMSTYKLVIKHDITTYNWLLRNTVCQAVASSCQCCAFLMCW